MENKPDTAEHPETLGLDHYLDLCGLTGLPVTAEAETQPAAAVRAVKASKAAKQPKPKQVAVPTVPTEENALYE
jgi:hypothetical protein